MPTSEVEKEKEAEKEKELPKVEIDEVKVLQEQKEFRNYDPK